MLNKCKISGQGKVVDTKGVLTRGVECAIIQGRTDEEV